MRTRSFLFAALTLVGSAYAFGVVGCSATNTSTSDDAGSGGHADSGTSGDDDGSVTGDDGSAGDDSSSGDDASQGDDGSLPKLDAGKDATQPLTDGGVCPGTAPTAGDLDVNGGWNGPKTRNTGACTAGDITNFQNNFQTAQTFADLKTGMSTSCKACVFSLESDAQWGPVVTDAQAQAGFINFGACYASLSGSSNCGKFVQYSEFCTSISCSQCADADYTACTQSQQTQDACSANFGAGIQSNCTGDATTLDNTCGNIINAAKYLCGP